MNKLENTNAKYKVETDRHRRFKSFDVGDGFINKARIQGDRTLQEFDNLPSETIL